MAVETVETTSKPSFTGPTLDKVTITRKGDEIIEPKVEEASLEDGAVVTSAEEQPKAEEKPEGLVKTGEEKPTEPTAEVAEGAPKTEEPTEYTQEDFHTDVNSYLSTQTGGAVKNPEDITRILNENKDLKTKLQHKEPDFPSEAAKKVYDLAILASGKEVEKAQQLFYVMSLGDLSKLSPKEKQFEAFVLDRPELTREEARKRFEARYERQYTDLDGDLVQIDDHEKATQDAANKIKEVQKSLSESVKQGGKQVEQGQQQDELTAEKQAQIETQLQSSLETFGGVRLKFDDSKYGALEIPMDKGKAKEFMDFLKNPAQAIQDRIAEKSKDQAGNFNYDAYVAEAFSWFNRDAIDQKTQDHLIKLGKIAEITERKNTPKKDLTEQQTTPVVKNFKQTFAEAVTKAGLGN